MLKIFRQHLAVQLSDAQGRELGIKLSTRYTPLIAGVKREYWNKIGLPVQPEDAWTLYDGLGYDMPLTAGDLYLVDPDTILYFKLPRGKGELEAGVITRKEPGGYSDFFSQLQGNVHSILPGFKGDWEPLGNSRLTVVAIAEEHAEPAVHPNKQEVEAAEELEGEPVRELLSLIIARNSVFLNKLCETRDKSTTERMVNRFEKLSLISRDYAVLCSKTGQQILRVASRAAIEDPSHKNFKCFICGKAINEELVDEIITASEFGKKLLSNDYWLLVRVIGAMQRLGISEDDILLHRDEDGLMNLSVTINQEAYLFVLANHKLGLNEAYLISAHVSAYNLDHVVIVSNERVSSLMRYHLEKSNPRTSFDVVDSLRALEEKFDGILREKEKRTLKECLEAFAALTPIRVQDLIMQRIAPDATYLADQPAEAATVPPQVEPAPEPVAGPVENGAAVAEHAPVRQEATVGSEEEPFYMEEVLPEDVATEG